MIEPTGDNRINDKGVALIILCSIKESKVLFHLGSSKKRLGETPNPPRPPPHYPPG